MNALVYVNIDQGIYKVKFKVALNEKRKKLRGFSFSINMANFEAFGRTKKVDLKPLFSEECCTIMNKIIRSRCIFISYSAVHVTESTKASLGDYFNCDPVAKDEIDDEILSGNQLNTYLIWPYKNEYNIGEVVYLILDLRS